MKANVTIVIGGDGFMLKTLKNNKKHMKQEELKLIISLQMFDIYLFFQLLGEPIQVDYSLLEKIIDFNIVEKADCSSFWR